MKLFAFKHFMNNIIFSHLQSYLTHELGGQMAHHLIGKLEDIAKEEGYVSHRAIMRWINELSPDNLELLEKYIIDYHTKH